VAEWLKAAVLKTAGCNKLREFESHRFRHTLFVRAMDMPNIADKLSRIASDLQAASDAWRKAKVPTYVKSENGQYLTKDGTWGTKAERRIFPNYNDAAAASASAPHNGYHSFCYRDSDGKPADPRDR
jgi:hypothetical protein